MTHPVWDKVGCGMFVSLFSTQQMSLSVLTAPVTTCLVIILSLLFRLRLLIVPLCPPQVHSSPSFCVWSPHKCERNLLTLMPPYLLGPLTCLLKMWHEWPGGGGQHEMFFLLWDWGTGCEDGVFSPFLPYFGSFQPLSSTSVIWSSPSPLHPVGGPSVAPDVTDTITPVPHPSDPPPPTPHLLFLWLPLFLQNPNGSF